MIYARIENGLAVELLETEGDISQMFHPSMLWVACDESVKVGDAYDGAGFTAPTAPSEATLVVPQTVTQFQARAALYLAGLLDEVEALMSAAETPALAKLAWQHAVEFRRDSPTVQTMASELGLTDQQIDQLFITASQQSA